MDILRRKAKPQLKPPDTLSRYVVTKHAWYKAYKRIFCITPTAIHTQNPERTLVLTNSYTFVGDSDIESVSLGGDEFEFVISARQDKKSKFKALKFSCKHRQLLLTDLYQCMAAANALGRCLLASKLLGPSQDFQAHKWSRSSSSWKPVVLRVTAFGLEALQPTSGAVQWRVDYHRLSAPGIMTLAAFVPPAGSQAGPQDGVFAVMLRDGRSNPRIFALRGRDTLLGQMQQAARKKLAVSIIVDSTGRSSLQELLHAVNVAERTSSSEASELPLGQWEVEALRGRADILPPQLLMASPAQSARKLSVEALAGMADVLVMSGANTVPRRLVVTPSSLITRRVDSHDVVLRRPLTAVAALVRFADDPKLLAVEWEDGAPPCQFVTPARDAVLAALLSAAQAASGRPIAVMPGFTCPGDVIVTDHKHASHAPASEPEPEMTHLYLAELNSRGREVAPCLNGSSMMFYQSHISFSSSPRGSTTQHSPLDSALPATPASAATLSTSPASSTGSSSAAAAAAAKLAAGGSAAAAHLRARAPEALSPQDAANLMLECVYEFNACVPYAGVSTVGAGEGFELDPQAIAAVLALLPEELQPGLPPPALAPDDVKQAVAVLHCLQRLAGHPLLAEQVLNAPGALGRLWACLGCGADHIVAEGARLLVRLFAPAPARHGAPPWRLLRAAAPLGSEEVYLTNTREDNSLAKTAKMLAFPPSSQADRLAVLLKPLAAQPPMSHLTSMALLEAVAAVAVDPGARTTDPSLQDAVLQAAAALGRPLFALFNHPASRVAEGTAVIMRAIAERGASAAAPMRDAALREGAILHHLQLALFASGDKAKLSQELVASWADSYAPALTLMQHIFPPGLVRYLNAPKPAAELKQQQQQQQQVLQQQRAAAASQSPPAAVQGMSAISTSPAGTVPTTAPAAMSASPAAAAATAAAAGGVAATPGQPAGGPGQQQQQMQQGLPSAAAGGAAVSPAAPAAAGAAGTASAAAAAAAASQNAAMGGAAPAAHAVSPAAAGAGVGPVANGNASYAVSGESLPVQQTGPQLQQQQQPAQQQPTVQQVTPGQARQLPQSVGGLKGNWPAFWTAASKDHCHAGLIWNESTRRELRDALEREEAGLRAARTRVAKGGGGWPSWNWEEFNVSYPSLGNQLCIGGVYVRLLLEGGDATAVQKLANPKEFFTACYHALLCCTDTTGSDAAASSDLNSSSSSSSSTSGGSTKASSNRDKITQQLCVKAMAAAYSAHAGTIGPFEGIPHLLQLLDTTPQRSLRHGLLLLVQALVAPKAAGDLSVLNAPPAAATTSSLPNVAGASSSSSKAAALSVNTAGASKAATTAAAGAPGSTAAAGQGVKLSQLPPAQAAAVKAAKANGYLLMDHGGLQLLVDVVAGAHECTERRMAAAAAGTAGAAAAGAGHLITSISHAEAPKEWCFYPNGYDPERSNKAGTAAAAAADSAPAGAPAAPSTSYIVGDETVPGPDETGRAGPMSKDALRQLHTKGVISSSTWVWAAGMQAPQQLGRVRELRWMLSSGLGLLGPFDAALVALQVLQQLASLQPAVDEEGSVLQPLPRAHRGIADPACLPHIAQVMLTGEPALVSAAAKLLTTVLAHNGPALSQLYLSGAFIFGLAYCGSNLAELAEMFKVAHLVQGFRGPAELLAGLPLVQRSYLGVLLPESLLHMLESYGPGVFAAALSGDHNTPEIIWTAAMRQQRLAPAMLQHLGDFPHRLSQHCHAVYEYTPPPPMSWPELADEIWCHRYYLANLCDEDRFRNWPVVEHIPLLQALMEQWRAELQRKPLSMSEGQACEALGLTPGPDGRVEEDDMRRAYRMLARRYHPDKNPSPEARAKFLQVQKAYERLQAGAAGGQGPQPWRLLLMLRAQCILFRRYAAVLAPFKYAGYPQLLEVLRQQQVAAYGAGSGAAKASTAAAAAVSKAAAMEQGASVQQAAGGGSVSVSSSSSSSSGHFLSGERISQVLAAIELCWLTCVASRRNAEELLRSGGLPLLAGLLTRCVGILPNDVAPLAAEAVITTHTLRTLAGLAAVDAARRDMEGQPQLLADIVKCCSLERAPAAVDAAIVAICYLAASPKLQHMLLESGALAVLIPLLLQYDVTLSAEASARLQLPFTTASSSSTAASGIGADGVPQQGLGPEASGLRLLDMALVRPNMQEARSQHALLAVQALARLAGMLRDPFHTPTNQPAQSALSALLTQSLSARLAESDPRPLLVCLNSSMETAQVIWNSGMREELLKALSAQRSQGTDLSALQSFNYSSLQGELQVGGVFIRVFNQRGRSSANASNATVTAATATAAVAAAPAAAAAGAHAGPLSTQQQPQQQQQRVPGGGAAAFAGPGGSGIPSDPAGFCKALVRYLYDRLVERCFRGAELQQLSAAEARNVLDVVTALSGLLENEPRLLGLLSSKSALSPLVACITPAAATWPPLYEQASVAAAAGRGRGLRESTDAAATTAAADGAHANAGSKDSTSSAGSTDAARLAETAEQLAILGLQLLLRATANAAVQEALTDEALLRHLYWLCVQPPSGRVLNAALALLRRLSSSPLAASVGGYQGGAVMLMSVLLHIGRWPWPGGDAPAAALAEQTDAAKAAAADVLGALMAQPSHGPRVSLLMGKLLPPGLVASIAEGPPAAVLRALGQTVETPECMWDGRMAAQAAAEVASLAAAVRQQHAGGSYDWSPPTGYQLEYDSLRGEVYVGGVYVRLFLKNPKYAVRDPVKFSEALVEKYLQELTAAAAAANSGAATAAASLDQCLLLSAAAVALLQGHGLLADHVAQLGSSGRLLTNLAARTARIPAPPPDLPQHQQHRVPPDELGGSILRLLHQLAASTGAAEAMAASTNAPVVPTLLPAMAWGHGASILVLETLKRALSPANRQRDSLVMQALQVGLVQKLLLLLDWRSGEAAADGSSGSSMTQAQEQELAVERTLAVDVLRLLSDEGSYSAQVNAILSQSPVWAAYRDQRHDMFLPSGATAETGVVGLLTAGDTARFALPAPESVQGTPSAATAGQQGAH